MKVAMSFTIVVFALLIGAIIAPGLRADASRISLRRLQEPIQPVPLGRKLRSLTLAKNSVIGGESLSGRVVLQFLAPNGGTNVALKLSSGSILPEDIESPKVQLPAGVEVPAGKTDATFSITTFSVTSERHITIEASAGGVTRTASFTIEPLQVESLTIVPAAGFGPFEAQGTVGLNVLAPADTSVRLTSSNPEVVRFGTVGNAQADRTVLFHRNESSKPFSLVASAVPQNTTVTVSASLNGKTVSRSVTVRH